MPASRSRTSATSAIAALALALALGGCSFVAGEQIPPEEKEAIAIGANTTVGELEVRSLLLVGTETGEPGRLLGSIFNGTDDDIDVTVADEDDEVSLRVPAGGVLALEEERVLIESIEQRPGSFVPLTLTTDDAQTEIGVPVRDGSLEQFEPFVPGD